jgi:hypothetical protein
MHQTIQKEPLETTHEIASVARKAHARTNFIDAIWLHNQYLFSRPREKGGWQGYGALG